MICPDGALAGLVDEAGAGEVEGVRADEVEDGEGEVVAVVEGVGVREAGRVEEVGRGRAGGMRGGCRYWSGSVSRGMDLVVYTSAGQYISSARTTGKVEHDEGTDLARR